MSISTLDLEFDDDALVKCDYDLVRCLLLVRLPDLHALNDTSSREGLEKEGDWKEIASTEWKKVCKYVIWFFMLD